MSDSIKFQRHATWLGYLGIIPFMAAGLLLTDLPAEEILLAIQAYGAIILTFIGAIHWGRAFNSNNSYLLLISVIPSLFAWASLLLPPAYGLPLLVICLLAVATFDAKQYHQLAWFRLLRIKLTFIVCSLLTISWLLS